MSKHEHNAPNSSKEINNIKSKEIVHEINRTLKIFFLHVFHTLFYGSVVFGLSANMP